MPAYPFEIIPPDFNGESCATDHRIAWVLAESRRDVERALLGTGATISDLPLSFLEQAEDSGTFDGTLPGDGDALRHFVMTPSAPSVRLTS